MDFPGSLQVVAEIGIGLAGFSGLIVALRKNAGPLTAIQKYRLQVLLSLAFGAMFLSFLPELLYSFGVNANSVWKFSSIGLSLFSVMFLAWLSTATLRMKVSHAEIFNWTVFSTLVAAHTIVLLVQIAFIFSLVDIAGGAAYSLALVWFLMHSAHQFVRMLFIQPAGTR